jgi:hypothetical protein
MRVDFNSKSMGLALVFFVKNTSKKYHANLKITFYFCIKYTSINLLSLTCQLLCKALQSPNSIDFLF